ncbi:MAG: HTTM domain-containing protein [Myxococcales bacterium]|nr:HTTM domain-containing protein [Myxococcales bacterium]
MTEAKSGSAAIYAWLRERYGLDFRSLAAFRIATASVILFDLADRAPQLRTFYSDQGMIARYVFDQSLSRTLLWPHFWSGSPGFQSLLFALSALVALAMLVGYRTRLATLLSWVLLCSLHFRNPNILNFGDSILRILLFWSIFLPLGERWSLDRRRGRRGAVPESNAAPGSTRILSVGAIAIQLQVAFLYFFSAMHKLGPQWMVDGSAVYYALSVDYRVYPLGLWLLQFPDLMKFLTFASLYLETIGPFLFFVPFYSAQVRLGTAIAFVALHLGIAASMRFGVFQLVPCAAMLLFVPGLVWDRWRKA